MARMLRAHGAKQKYHNEMVGYNSRMVSLQAAILRVKLPQVDEWNQKRRRAAETYNELLNSVPGLSIPSEKPNDFHVYHQYTVRIGGDDAPKYSNCFRPEVLEQQFTIRSQYLNCQPTCPHTTRETQEYVATTLRQALRDPFTATQMRHARST
jgi:dTDP-4-amino-4,6-dideoxygalactose transaminase